MKESEPKLIAITGGPCSGKSALLEHLQADTEISSRALFVPEAATMVLPGFLAVRAETDYSRTGEWQLNLQRCISRLQISLEDTYREAAYSSGKDIIVCDRGLNDAEVYTEAAEDIYNELGYSAHQLLMRYYGVIHLESLATSAPEKFSNDNNPNRYEDCHEATSVEYRTREAWEGHPRWEFVEGQSDIKDKIAAAMTIINQLAN